MFNPATITYKPANIGGYFRRFLPVVVDVETGGLNPQQHALLEIGITFLKVASSGLELDQSLSFHIEPFAEGEISEQSKKVLDWDFLRTVMRQPEQEVMLEVIGLIEQRIQREGCTRAILVGHNAPFDLSFVQAALQRYGLRSPFHQFSTLDTVSIAALLYGHTVLSKACQTAGIDWDSQQAHSALYDCRQTAKLFCQAVNVARRIA